MMLVAAYNNNANNNMQYTVRLDVSAQLTLVNAH